MHVSTAKQDARQSACSTMLMRFAIDHGPFASFRVCFLRYKAQCFLEPELVSLQLKEPQP